MPGRSFNGGNYRYGYNGHENDNEITGSFGTHTSAEYWEYDSRLGRRWNIDPVPIAWNSSYACFNGNPIYYKDPRGLTAEGGGDKGKKKGSEPLVTGNNTDGYTFVEVDITSKSFWQKVGSALKSAWNAFVEWDSALGTQKDKNDFTAPDKSKIIRGGQMPTSKGNAYNNNSIQGSHVLSNPEVVRNDGIFNYMPGSVAGGSEQSGLVQKMGTGVKGQYQFRLQGGKEITKGFNGSQSNGLGIGEGIDNAINKDETKAALTNGNESTVQQSTDNAAKRVMMPEAPVLIYYSIQTNDGFTVGTEQATQKDYKSKIKTMESQGYTIERVDRQLKK